MKWFKHETGAHMNATLRKIKRQFGMAGIGRYWTLVELVGAEMKSHGDECTLKLPVKDWANSLGLKSENLKAFVEFLTDICNISHRYLPEVCEKSDKSLTEVSQKSVRSLEDELEITIPKLLELRDSRNRVRQPRGIIDKDIDKDKEGEEEKKASQQCLIPKNLKADKRLYDHYIKKGCKAVLFDEVFEDFETHHTKKGTKFADWYAGFRTWVKNELKYHPERHGKVDKNSGLYGMRNAADMISEDPRYANTTK